MHIIWYLKNDRSKCNPRVHIVGSEHIYLNINNDKIGYMPPFTFLQCSCIYFKNNKKIT